MRQICSSFTLAFFLALTFDRGLGDAVAEVEKGPRNLPIHRKPRNLAANSNGNPRNVRNLNDLDFNNNHGHHQLDADDPDFNGIVDFSDAEPGPGGSWCITKVNYVDHMVKDQVKECWHENVTQCHDTYVTEFLPSQEQKCEESFWKSCKIDFRDMPYNYTMKHCHTPLVKSCDPNYTGNPEIVCKTWFESECNTTFTETTPNVEDKPNTWCQKVPRKICAPDNCKMIPGEEQCNDKVLVSTVQKPTELCDLQPTKHCRLITRLTPHLLSKEVCKEIPKEVCHLALSAPKNVKKPVTLKWCTRNKPQQANQRRPRPSYLPPPPSPSQQPQQPVYRPKSSQSSPAPTYASPANNQRLQNFQVRSDDNVAYESNVKVTKFRPGSPNKFEPQKPSVSAEEESNDEVFQPVFQDQFKPALRIRQDQSIQLPEAFKAQLDQAGLLNKDDKKKDKRVVEVLEASEEIDLESLKNDEAVRRLVEDGFELVEIDGRGVGNGGESVEEVVEEDQYDDEYVAEGEILSEVQQHQPGALPASITEDLSGGAELGAEFGVLGGAFLRR